MNVSHIKWVLVGVVIAVFVPWWLVVVARESACRQALELYSPLTDPKVTIHFDKTISWDPQSFLGRGRQAGFWDWSPKGVVLTNRGQNLFGDTPKDITGELVAGKREITTIKSVQNTADGREVTFLYKWTETTDAVKLLNAAPTIGKEYEAVAMVVEDASGWKVKSLADPEFTRALDILAAQARGEKL